MFRHFILIAALVLVTWFSRLLEGAALHSPPGYPLIAVSLLAGMLIILAGCELFANGVEHLGDRMNMSHATTGSLLAGVGTALPETIVPILALIAGNRARGQEIAIGAILGAPFMLSTLALFLLGLTVLSRGAFKKDASPTMSVNANALRFELGQIIFAMTLIFLASVLRVRAVNYLCASILFVSYLFFISRTMKHEAEEGEEYTEAFHFGTFLGYEKKPLWISLQVLAGLFLMIGGASVFVDFISLLAVKSGISALALSLIIVPFATELPEKVNSISWTLRGRDTLAIGNITGSMVFQSTVPASIGLIFTSWSLGRAELLDIISVILMSALLRIAVARGKKIPAAILLVGGIFYLVYIMGIVF
ncbi:MAG: hypothetical protein M0033_05490 [Nitrospiraceae bacterium]|nr:hypothetical protein [Nitrospiraceae bacterium]